MTQMARIARMVIILAVVLLAVSPVVASGGALTPEIDWFHYNQKTNTFQWQTFEEVMVRGFSIEFAPETRQGLAWEPPVSLWSSGYIVAQHPGSTTGAYYEVPAPANRLFRPRLCTWYATWWVCDRLPDDERAGG